MGTNNLALPVWHLESQSAHWAGVQGCLQSVSLGPGFKVRGKILA